MTRIISHKGGVEELNGNYYAYLEIREHPEYSGHWRSRRRFDNKETALDYLGSVLLKANYSFSMQRFRRPWILYLKFQRIPLTQTDSITADEEGLEQKIDEEFGEECKLEKAEA